MPESQHQGLTQIERRRPLRDIVPIPVLNYRRLVS
uniref:Atp1, OrsajM_p50 n=1 Tax=Arundo donax TaxID=35708 RepID=A0A0A8Z3J2_ARUDO